MSSRLPSSPSSLVRSLASVACVLACGSSVLAQGPVRLPGQPSGQTAQPTPDRDVAERREPNTIRFAVIGDFGDSSPEEFDVSALMKGWKPEFIITCGDNNYPDGEALTIDPNIGQYFHEFIYPYVGGFGSGSEVNRFFPTIGNHDWTGTTYQPYLDYFDLPGNERYYDFVWGPTHFFALNSDPNEPDGFNSSSTQAQWLQDALANSKSAFKVVYYHHTQHTSGQNGPTFYMGWPFRAWGADLIFAGHDHHYERFFRDDIPLFVNGTGGRSLRPMGDPAPGSQIRYNEDFGAMLVTMSEELVHARFITRGGYVMDEFAMTPAGLNPVETLLVQDGDTWKYLDDGTDQGTTWSQVGFNDTSWSSGPSELGYGDGDEATVVGFGPDPENKFPTTYFRKEFNIVDASLYGSMRIRLMRDDGAIVYLDGVEMVRSNMPAGAVDYLTLASESSGSFEDDFLEFEIDPSGLAPGTHLLAVELHQSHIDSPDISFNLEVLATMGTLLVPIGSDWQYDDTGVAPASDWRELGFDASSWSVGPAEFGYGDGDEATVVSFGGDPQNKHITTYFRHTFTVTDPTLFSAFLLKVRRDDGVDIHINGKRVYRSNLPTGLVANGALAGSTITGIAENEYITTSIDPKRLVAGTNIITAEIHQADAASEDLSFDLTLHALQ